MDDGVCRIYKITNTAAPGDMPADGLVLCSSYYFEERVVGMSRYYSALQVQSKIARIVRIWQDRSIEADNVCLIENDSDTNGVQYRIIQAQHIEDANGLKVSDLTLERLVEPYVIN